MATIFRGLIKIIMNVINLIFGKSNVYSEEEAEGDLGFNPTVMMKIGIILEKNFEPKKKMVIKRKFILNP